MSSECNLLHLFAPEFPRHPAELRIHNQRVTANVQNNLAFTGGLLFRFAALNGVTLPGLTPALAADEYRFSPETLSQDANLISGRLCSQTRQGRFLNPIPLCVTGICSRA